MSETKGQRTRARVISAAADLMQRQGYQATGVNQVLAEAGAPRGSLYFHFPGGKEELAAEAVTAAGADLGRRMAERMTAAPDVVGALRSVTELMTEQLVSSGYERGCPVATVALELTSAHDLLQQVCAQAFTAWEAGVAELLRTNGFPDDAARDRATVILAALEGALLLARTRRSPEPMQRVAAMMPQLLAVP